MTNRDQQTLTIASGAQASGEYYSPGGVRLMTLLAPSTLPESVTLQKAESTGGTFRTFQDVGVSVSVSAGMARTVVVSGGFYRLYASVAVAANRAFTVELDW